MSDVHRRVVQRWNGQEYTLENDHLADESVVHLLLNGTHVTTLLATGADLEDLCRGHFVTELNLHAEDVRPLPQVSETDGVFSVNLEANVLHQPTPRATIVTTSCGACNLDGLPDLVALQHRVSEPEHMLELEQLTSAMHKMRNMQTVFSQTGGVHAAGVWYPDGTLIVREDIGRHNAVDKILGHHIATSHVEKPLALLLSGRCGWDIVAKASRMNISIIASIGAASHLAADVARSTNITLVTFLQEGAATIIGPVEGRFRGKD